MTTNKRHPNIVNANELDWVSFGNDEKFASRSKRLGALTGASQLGCSLYEVKPGMRAFPHHAHARNEEALYILSGKASLRLGTGDTEQQFEVGPGDYITLPANLNLAHQLICLGNETLRYLCISTTVLPEIVTYPDSNKAGMMVEAESAPASWPTTRGRAFKLLKDGDSLDYFLDE